MYIKNNVINKMTVKDPGEVIYERYFKEISLIE